MHTAFFINSRAVKIKTVLIFFRVSFQDILMIKSIINFNFLSFIKI